LERVTSMACRRLYFFKRGTPGAAIGSKPSTLVR
jgi:hypothetical protein